MLSSVEKSTDVEELSLTSMVEIIFDTLLTQITHVWPARLGRAPLGLSPSVLYVCTVSYMQYYIRVHCTRMRAWTFHPPAPNKHLSHVPGVVQELASCPFPT